MIDGGENGSVVTFYQAGDGGGRMGIEGFTIINGDGDSMFSNTWGGGIFCYESSPHIIKNHIKENKANYGGGICCMCNQGGVVAAPTISYNTIEDNESASAGVSRGGGICCWIAQGDVEISNNTITENYSYDSGGGIFIHEDSSNNNTITIKDNLIDENTCVYFGGGIYASGYGSLDIIDNEICNNNNSGIYISKSGTDQDAIDSNLIHSNSTDGDGGGIYMVNNNAVITNNMIYRNSADFSLFNGGGVYAEVSAGVGARTRTFTNNTITNNSASNGTGGGVYLTTGSNVTFTNEIIYGNTAATGSVNELDFGTTAPTVTFSDVESYNSPGNPWPDGGGNTNIWSNPSFVNATGDNYHLPYNSPCVGAGDNNATGIPRDDFEGDNRILPQPSGVVDMGADEYKP